MIQFEKHIFQMRGSKPNYSQSVQLFLNMFTSVTTRNDSHLPQMFEPFLCSRKVSVDVCFKDFFSFGTFHFRWSFSQPYRHVGGEVPGLTSQYQAR